MATVPEADPVAVDLCGPWYWGTSPQVLRLNAGGLLELAPVGATGRAARFRAEPDGSWTGLNGYYAGRPCGRSGARTVR